VKIDLSHLHLYNQYEGYSHTRQKKIKQMDFKSNPGSYVNVYVQMRSMTGKQKHCKKNMVTGEANMKNGGASSRGNAGVNM